MDDPVETVTHRGRDTMSKALETQQFDDDDYDEELWDQIRDNGEVVASHEWNSGAPGAGAGAVYVYLYDGAFYAEDDDECFGPCKTFQEAADAVVLWETDATTGLWIDPRYK
jgi:hypothetical protein